MRIMSHHFKRHHAYSKGYRPRRHRGRLRIGRLILLILVFAAIISAIVFGILFLIKAGPFVRDDASSSVPAVNSAAEYDAPMQTADSSAVPAAVDATQPAAFGLTSEIEQDGNIVTTFTRLKEIFFPAPNSYANVRGITTADGNDYRDSRSFGGFEAGGGHLETLWRQERPSSAAVQPIAVSWDADMRQMMNLYPDKASREDLVEILSCGADGTLSFTDLADGSATRDPISLGFTPGGALSLDPRGYPLLYIGGNAENACMNIYSLITGELLYKYGGEKDSFALLDSERGFSCSPLVSGDTDTLIWPGGNGILYTMNLNSDFDRAAGTVSLNPDTPVKYRYTATGGADSASPASFSITGLSAWRNYAFITDTGGYIQCIDINTMQPVYVQKLGAGIVSSPLIEEAADGIYLYSGSKSANGNASVYKLKGLSGEIIWQRDLACGAEGGFLSTPVSGRGDLDGMIFCMAAQADGDNAVLLALTSDTGEIKWEQKTGRPSVFSPAAAYTSSGTGYLLEAGGGGAMLLAGNSGEVLGTLDALNGADCPAIVCNTVAVLNGTGVLIK